LRRIGQSPFHALQLLSHCLPNAGSSAGLFLINVGGLAVGLGVATLIGLWMHDELTFNTYHRHYDRIARLTETQTYQGNTGTSFDAAPAYGPALRLQYGSDFAHVLMASHPQRIILAASDKKLMRTGYYFEPGVTEMLSLKMRRGTPGGLREPASVLLSASVAAALFGEADPLGKTSNSTTQTP
jgi:hypothetical protein